MKFYDICKSQYIYVQKVENKNVQFPLLFLSF